MESLLILKKLLNWSSLDNIAFIIMNKNRGHRDGAATRESFREKIKTWNRADSALYDYSPFDLECREFPEFTGF